VDRGEEFRRWSNAIVAGGGGTPQDRSEVGGMYSFFTEVIEERRRAPGEDLISRLLATEHEGEHLTQQQVLNLCALMLVAGHETTTNLIANAVLCLAQRPDVLEAVRSDLSLVSGVIEEVLRYASPVQAVVRYARQDCVLGGQQIKAGEVIFPSLGSAHRDPAAFPDPDHFVISREHGMEIPFGHGIHYCIGASLARLEAGTLLPMLVERLPGQWTVSELDFDPTLQRFLFAPRRLIIQRAARHSIIV
jgi:cytochrome P450